MAQVFGFDCYAPKEIAERVEAGGVTKARLPLLSMMALGVLAGGFIGLGALYFTLVTVTLVFPSPSAACWAGWSSRLASSLSSSPAPSSSPATTCW